MTTRRAGTSGNGVRADAIPTRPACNTAASTIPICSTWPRTCVNAVVELVGISLRVPQSPNFIEQFEFVGCIRLSWQTDYGMNQQPPVAFSATEIAIEGAASFLQFASVHRVRRTARQRKAHDAVRSRLSRVVPSLYANTGWFDTRIDQPQLTGAVRFARRKEQRHAVGIPRIARCRTGASQFQAACTRTRTPSAFAPVYPKGYYARCMRIRQTKVFEKWLRKLRDRKARARIGIRIRRLSLGSLGDVRPVGNGVSELRIDYGPGYRVYVMVSGSHSAVLLIGGDKRTQGQDIRRAHELARELMSNGG